MKIPTVLVLEADDYLQQSLSKYLKHRDVNIIEFTDESCLLQSLAIYQPDLIIIGPSKKFAWDIFEVAANIRQSLGSVPIILLTNHSSEKQAIASIKLKIADYFVIPFAWDELAASVRRELNLAATPLEDKPGGGSEEDAEHILIGKSSHIERIRRYIRKVARTESNLLITGETGTGKDLVARMVHHFSPRCGQALISINCAALPETLLESELFGYEKGAFTGAGSAYEGKLKLADKGTIFLDEIGDMTPYTQAKLLRFVESKEFFRLGGKKNIAVDTRILSASNQDLEDMMEQGAFRKDLYFRLNVAQIHLPPLRQRREDIPRLLDFFLEKMNALFGAEVTGFTSEAFDFLVGYEWPGNVREMKNVLEAAFINLSSTRISSKDLPERLHKQLHNRDEPAADSRERDILLSALRATNWNKSQAALKLQWSRATLYRKLGKYNIPGSKKSALPKMESVSRPWFLETNESKV